MQTDNLKHLVESYTFGTDTQYTASQRQSQCINFDQLLQQSSNSISHYETEIATIENQIKTIIQVQPLEFNIQQSHFSAYRKSNLSTKEIVITSEYLQDSVFQNINEYQKRQIEAIFNQAKTEIQRLTQILHGKDKQIDFLKSQLSKSLKQQITIKEQGKKVDSLGTKHMQEFDLVILENKILQQKVNTLTVEIQSLKNKSVQNTQNQTRKISSNVMRITANKPIIKEGVSMISSGVTTTAKQKKSVETQTDQNNQKWNNLVEELNFRRGEVQNLQRCLSSLTQQFESIKNDNFLFVQDIQNLKLRVQQLEKIDCIQKQHIQSQSKQLLQYAQKYQFPTTMTNKQSPLDQSSKQASQDFLQKQQLRTQLNATIQYMSNQIKTLLSEKQDLKGKISVIDSNSIGLQRRIQQLYQQNNLLRQNIKNEKDYNKKQKLAQDLKLQMQIQRNKQLQIKIQVQEKLMHDIRQQKSKIDLQLNRFVQTSQEKQRESNIYRAKTQKEIERITQCLSEANLQIQKINIERQKAITDIALHVQQYEIAQGHIDNLRKELLYKETRVLQLEKKLQQSQNVLKTSQKQIFNNNKNQSKSPQELIGLAKTLIYKRNKTQNLDQVYNVLDIIASEFESMRKEFINLKVENSQGRDLSIFEQQTNLYIQTLLNNISQNQSRLQLLQKQNKELKQCAGKLDLIYEYNDNKQWDDLISELQFQKKLTQKLSEHVKILKDQIFNLTNQVTRKNEEIFALSSRIYKGGCNLQEIDLHLGSLQDQYYKLLNNSQNRKKQSRLPNSEQLINQLQMYRLELEKAVNLNQYLKTCLLSDGQCKDCHDYQILVEQLQARLQNYQKLMMGQLRRIFTSCQKEINRKQRVQIHYRIENLKQKTNNRNSRRLEKEFLKPRRTDSPVVKKYVHALTRTIYKRHTTLDHLVQSEKLSLQSILVIMSKIIDEVDQDKLFLSIEPILLENIEITGYDKIHPQNSKVEIVSSRRGSSSKCQIYLAPERLRGQEATRKSLVWNIGLIFHFIVNKKAFFTSQSDVLNTSLQYRYDNKLLPQLKPIIEGMLQKQVSKRKLFSHVKNIVSNQISRLKIYKSRT